jgi:hypothetical protein
VGSKHYEAPHDVVFSVPLLHIIHYPHREVAFQLSVETQLRIDARIEGVQTLMFAFTLYPG